MSRTPAERTEEETSTLISGMREPMERVNASPMNVNASSDETRSPLSPTNANASPASTNVSPTSGSPPGRRLAVRRRWMGSSFVPRPKATSNAPRRISGARSPSARGAPAGGSRRPPRGRERSEAEVARHDAAGDAMTLTDEDLGWALERRGFVATEHDRLAHEHVDLGPISSTMSLADRRHTGGRRTRLRHETARAGGRGSRCRGAGQQGLWPPQWVAGEFQDDLALVSATARRQRERAARMRERVATERLDANLQMVAGSSSPTQSAPASPPSSPSSRAALLVAGSRRDHEPGARVRPRMHSRLCHCGRRVSSRAVARRCTSRPTPWRNGSTPTNSRPGTDRQRDASGLGRAGARRELRCRSSVVHARSGGDRARRRGASSPTDSQCDTPTHRSARRPDHVREIPGSSPTAPDLGRSLPRTSPSRRRPIVPTTSLGARLRCTAR